MIRGPDFLKGFLVGFSMCLIFMQFPHQIVDCTSGPSQRGAARDEQILYKEDLLQDTDVVAVQEIPSPCQIVQANEAPTARASRDTRLTSTSNHRRPRILCWIMTVYKDLMKKAVHVHDTWGRRCDKLLFFISNGTDSSSTKPVTTVKSDNVNNNDTVKSKQIRDNRKTGKVKKNEEDEYIDYASSDRTLPIVVLDIPEGRQHLTAKTMHAFDYIFQHYKDDFDWFFKGDDDTYVVMENFRHFLSQQDENKPQYFGHHFKRMYVWSGYNSGGSGYVLSKEALRRYGSRPKGTKKCYKDGEDEDVDIGRCMEYLGVKVGYTADQSGAIRFLCFSMKLHLMGKLPSWTKRVDAYGAKTGISSISGDVISFHYVEPWMMYAIEYFVYKLQLRSDL